MNNKSVHLRSLILLVLIFTLATIQSHAIVVFINHGVFKNTDKSSFAELYLKVPISSIDLKINEQNKYTASVNVKLEYSYDDSIYASGEFNIVSPEFADTADLNFALTDLLRVVLPYGTYNFQV
ncbi:MAG: hypothetical protein HN691_04840, partial [Bacteroidetes bacterium]|nr:hypothetical protein [Bacteroidota bacterium]